MRSFSDAGEFLEGVTTRWYDAGASAAGQRQLAAPLAPGTVQPVLVLQARDVLDLAQLARVDLQADVGQSRGLHVLRTVVFADMPERDHDGTSSLRVVMDPDAIDFAAFFKATNGASHVTLFE